MAAHRDQLATALQHRQHVAHSGLVLSRYLDVPVKDKGHPDAKKRLYGVAVKEASRNVHILYQKAYQRRKARLSNTPQALFRADGRLIIGLGNASVLEASIALHHIYGVPVIPGSALKGLAAHYCDRVWGEADHEFRSPRQPDEPAGKRYQILFGTTDDCGHLMFHDAWIDPDCLLKENEGLLFDAMTPHHGKYYVSDPDKGVSPPTDFDDPNPVSFLSVAGRFHVAVSCDIPRSADLDQAEPWWDSLALQLVQQALQHWGVGGKTSSGYGRLQRSQDPVRP